MHILSKLSNDDIISEFWMPRMSLGISARLWLQITTFFRIFHFVKSCEPNTILLNPITTYSCTNFFMTPNLTIKRRSYFLSMNKCKETYPSLLLSPGKMSGLFIFISIDALLLPLPCNMFLSVAFFLSLPEWTI